MGKERPFWTGSTNILSDARPSGLDMRVYGCISLHDGMSLKNGKGRGCYASYDTLTSEIGCDKSNLSKSLKRLVQWGYLTQERQSDGRRWTYRVVFESPENWRDRQQSCRRKLVDLPTNEPEPLAGSTTTDPEIVGHGTAENGRNPPQTEQHYISLKGLNDLKELNPPEGGLVDILKIDPAMSESANLDALELALKKGQPVERVDWHVFLKFSNDLDRGFRLFDQLTAQMKPIEIKASEKRFMEEYNGGRRGAPSSPGEAQIAP